MRYSAVAFDYDGTLAKDGKVDARTMDALRRLRESGRRLLLVSGRILDELRSIFPGIEIFDKVVVENGAVLFAPQTDEIKLLGEPVHMPLVDELEKIGAKPVFGMSIVATWTPFESSTLEAIKKLGLEHAVIFNKGAVMVLPPGVNKASGLRVALSELGTSEHNMIAIGDAENDHAMLNLAEFAVAVQNALPAVKERADYVTEGDHGAGVIELIDMLLQSDLEECAPSRHSILLGRDKITQQEISCSAYGARILICGSSNSGKTWAMAALLDKLREGNYQFCFVDTLGKYEAPNSAVMLGTADGAPTIEELTTAIEQASQSVMVNLTALKGKERETYLTEAIEWLEAMRRIYGRPHWVIVDKAQYLGEKALDSIGDAMPDDEGSLVFIVSEPEQLAPAMLETIDIFISFGQTAYELLNSFAEATGRPVPYMRRVEIADGEAILWICDGGEPPVVADIEMSDVGIKRAC